MFYPIQIFSLYTYWLFHMIMGYLYTYGLHMSYPYPHGLPVLIQVGSYVRIWTTPYRYLRKLLLPMCIWMPINILVSPTISIYLANHSDVTKRDFYLIYDKIINKHGLGMQPPICSWIMHKCILLLHHDNYPLS